MCEIDTQIERRTKKSVMDGLMYLISIIYINKVFTKKLLFDNFLIKGGKKMECPTKKMTSYQRLKWELEKMYKAYTEQKKISLSYSNALWRITQLKEEQSQKATKIAMDALLENMNK